MDGVASIRPFATSFWKQLGHLLVRQSRTTWRDPASSVVGLAQGLIMAFVLGSVFYQLGFINPASVQGRTGGKNERMRVEFRIMLFSVAVLFFIMINDAFSLSQTGISWVEERLLVNRERASGTYGDLPYFLAKVLVETPIQILQTGLFVTIMYWMAQLNQGAVQFFLFYAINICTSLAAVALYSVIGVLSPNTTVASILIAMMSVLFFQFSGFLINSDKVHELLWCCLCSQRTFGVFADSCLVDLGALVEFLSVHVSGFDDQRVSWRAICMRKRHIHLCHYWRRSFGKFCNSSRH